MSTVKKAALKLAQENPEFRRALLRELKAATPPKLAESGQSLNPVHNALKLRHANHGSVPRFKTYDEVTAWVAAKVKEYGGKNKFFSSPEYRQAHPVINKLYKEVKRKYDEKKQSEGAAAMEAAGVSYGDRVRYQFVGPFLQIQTLTGKVIRRKGVPYVRLNEPVSTTKGLRKEVRWHKEFRRMGSQKPPRKLPPETPLQKAVWNAWDYLDGVDKIPETKALLFVLGGIEGEALISDEVDTIPGFMKLPEKIGRAVKLLEKQTRSWRSAYNLSVEGKITLDERRLVQDLTNTRKILATIHKDLETLKRTFTSYDMGPTLDLLRKTDQAFQQAIRSAK